MRDCTEQERETLAAIFGTNDEVICLATSKVVDKKEIKADTWKHPLEIHLEVTINYPKNKFFLGLDEQHRKAVYTNLFDSLKDYLRETCKDYIDGIITADHEFEHEGTENLHMHGIIRIPYRKAFCLYGLVEESFRWILRDVPPCRNCVNTMSKMTFKIEEDYVRMRVPALCIQGSKLNAQGWEDYMKKTH